MIHEKFLWKCYSQKLHHHHIIMLKTYGLLLSKNSLEIYVWTEIYFCEDMVNLVSIFTNGLDLSHLYFDYIIDRYSNFSLG